MIYLTFKININKKKKKINEDAKRSAYFRFV